MSDDTKKLLIVDDSKLALYRLREIISELKGFEVAASAQTGNEAIELYKEFKPDIVIMDLVMPEMSGSQTSKKILEYDERAKIIVVSALGSSSDSLLEQLDSGAVTVVAKPYNESSLKEILEKLSNNA